MNQVFHRNALNVLYGLSEESIDLAYIDPPFGVGHSQTLGDISFDDPNKNYIEWLRPHIVGIRRVLKQSGTLYFHLDHHWVHRAKVMIDDVFGSECFLNEIIWSYNFGGRGKRCWPKKHDSILVYVKDPNDYIFNWDEIPRIPYKAPDMQKVGRSPEAAAARVALGQVPTDVWDMSIVGTNSKERNGYPTQKPVKLIERAILASSPSDGVILDVFAGSGTTGEAAFKNGRSFILADVSHDAVKIMQKRFSEVPVAWIE